MILFKPYQFQVRGISTNKDKAILRFSLILLLAITLIRFIHLSADVPFWFASDDIGLHIDEGYKTYAALNYKNYGKSNWNKSDDYPTWFESSSLTQWSYYISFKFFGTKISSARFISVLTFFFILFIFAVAFSKQYKSIHILLGILLLSFEPFLFIHSRVALFEIYLSLFTAIGLIWVYLTMNKKKIYQIIGLLAISLFSFFFIKASGIIYLLPSLLILFGLLAFNNNEITLKNKWITFFCFITFSVAFLYFTKNIWIGRIDIESLSTYHTRFAFNSSFRNSSLIILAALICTLNLLKENPRQIYNDNYKLCLIASIIGIPLILAVFPYSPSRYYTPAMIASPLLIIDHFARPPGRKSSLRKSWTTTLLQDSLCILIIWIIFLSVNHNILERIPINIGDDPGLSMYSLFYYIGPAAIPLGLILSRKLLKIISLKNFLSTVLILFFINNIYFQFNILSKPTYNGAEIGKKIAKILNKNQSIIGDWAPYFGLIAERKSLYSNNVFNPIKSYDALSPDYFINSHTPNDIANYILLIENPLLHVEDKLFLGNFLNRPITLHKITLANSKTDLNLSNLENKIPPCN